MKIIAESAFNHNGDLSYLKKLANAAKDSRVDYFTVQVMNPEAFCTEDYSKFKIYKDNTFKQAEWLELFDYCKTLDLEIIPCVLEEDSFQFCYQQGYTFFKIHGTDLTNLPFLTKIKNTPDCKVIIETQCATYQDIETCVNLIGDRIVAIFHGFSDYPTEIEESKLNSIDSIKRDFPGFKIGYADHSLTVSEIPLMALAKGYDFLEKHITLTRNNRNFDWQVSLYPQEFALMVNSIRMYENALGKNQKHPSKREHSYRDVIYKKVIDSANQLKRSNSGLDYLTEKFKSFSKDDVGIALIARLKSQRLKGKALKPFLGATILQDLFSRLDTCSTIKGVYLATSKLDEDYPLVSTIGEQKSFRGHDISVLDRMLSLAKEKEWGGILRVTGDNPFTDPVLIDKMVNIFQENDLDYVRVNNVPFGVSAELFSISYLWNLYLNMEDPSVSEYLSWFVLNDNEAKKGCINFIPKNERVSFVNLSIDYEDDYNRALELLKKISKSDPTQIQLSDIISNIDLNDIMDKSKMIKLPEGQSIIFEDYLKLMNNINYSFKLDLYEKDIFNW